MKPFASKNRKSALTLIELLVILAVIAVLAAMLLPTISVPKDRWYNDVSCFNNLKQVGLAYRVWAGDNNDKLPMEVSVTEGGAKELIATGNVVATFEVMSNELSTPKVLYCRKDQEHDAAISFDANFTAKNISFFIGVDAVQSSLK